MRIAYFDCFAGISGDMVLGALIDAGVELPRLQAEIDKLGIPGLLLEAAPCRRQGIAGTHAQVRVAGQPLEPDDEHHLELRGEPDHGHGGGRHPADIQALLAGSALDAPVRARASQIFARLAAAEASVHGADVAEVHLHEVGALDAVADVVGAAAGLELLGVEAVYSSPLRLGTGLVDCAHGRYPVPVPGVLELCRGVPCVQTDIAAELVTPTGAAIITTLAAGFGAAPPFRLERIGYGAGCRDLEAVPNFLRVRVGTVPAPYERDELIALETNIDDANPEVLGYLAERLLADGARDVFITPVLMKKGRPGSLLTVLLDEADLDRLTHRVLADSTSAGVRFHRVERRKLPRKQVVVQTEYGPVRVKLSQIDGEWRGAPEYEDCAQAARARDVSILAVYAAAQAALKDGDSHGQTPL